MAIPVGVPVSSGDNVAIPVDVPVSRGDNVAIPVDVPVSSGDNVAIYLSASQCPVVSTLSSPHDSSTVPGLHEMTLTP